MDSFINEDLTTLENITPFLKQCVGKGKEIAPGNILQVQQVVNISFPTYDKPSYSPDNTLKLTVTDGQSQGYALIPGPDNCPGISTNTPPGTKIKITQAIAVQGSLFVLTKNNCEVLGGRVPKLFEKWEVQKKMAIKHEWGYTGSSVEGEGPPPWKPFGQKSTLDVSALRRMKTIDVVSEKKDGQAGAAKSQFDMQRDEAISELQATANKQKFQKPNKHLLDKEITDIMDEGFSQSDAEYAMKRFKNTQKALKFLKEAKQRQNGLPRDPPKPAPERKDRRRKGKGLDEDEEQEVPAEYQRPTKSISLFGFIEGRIKSDDKPAVQTHGPSSQSFSGRSRDLEDGMSRLNFKDSREDRSYGKSDRGRGRGGYRGNHDRGNDRAREPYQPQQQRYEGNKASIPETSQQKPPRFQSRGGGNEGRFSDYNYSSNSRNQSSNAGNYDSYHGPGRDSYEARSYPSDRQDYSSGYQSQRQQHLSHGHQRQSGGKERSYGSDYHSQQQHQQYKASEYPVPSQSYEKPYMQQHSQGPRHYTNNNSHNQEGMGHSGHSRSSGQSGRPLSGYHSYRENTSGGHPSQPPQGEFTHYQYGYEDWNPTQSLVFTRSKGEGRGSRGGGGYSGRGASAHGSSYNSRSNNRY